MKLQRLDPAEMRHMEIRDGTARQPGRLVRLRNVGLAMIVLSVAYGCETNGAEQTSASEASYDPASTEAIVQDSMKSCTETYGYDPHTAKAPENALADGELEWRNCMYQALETKVIPVTKAPGPYRELIAEDKAMTTGIENGSLTRRDRAARIDELVKDIRAAEAKAMVEHSPEMEATRAQERTDFVRNMISPMRM